MNWKIIVGLLFLLGGMKVLYELIEKSSSGQLAETPVYAEVGCVVWMAVGIFLVMSGMRKRDQ